MPESKRQALNPFLPPEVCIADGEPHVFGNRVYLFGSHDRPGGETFCERDYEVWSASVDDLGSWTSHGTVYSASQDPGYCSRKPYLFAPDVMRGNDGRFYLYYSLGGWRGKGGYEGPISVAVSDSPCGKYEYLGFVRNSDGSPFRSRITFDPGVINDGGVPRLYFGTSYFFDEYKRFPTKTLYRFIESRVFGRSFSEMKERMTGAYTVRLAEDMRTVIGEPMPVVPPKTRGTPFEGHAFFEAASIRKFDGRYYFIYSSRNNHELCCAVSDRADGGFSYGGTLVSNGDIGYNGRRSRDRQNQTGNNHGSIERIGDKYYVFYHRMTDKSTYSRQACAEEIQIKADGSIEQVQMTSCGLNGAPLKAEGEYPASIACVLTNGRMPHIVNGKSDKALPCVAYRDGRAVLADITDGVTVGWRFFLFLGAERLTLELRGGFRGTARVSAELGGEPVAEIPLSPCEGYARFESAPLDLRGTHAIYLEFRGTGSAEVLNLGFC